MMTIFTNSQQHVDTGHRWPHNIDDDNNDNNNDNDNQSNNKNNINITSLHVWLVSLETDCKNFAVMDDKYLETIWF